MIDWLLAHDAELNALARLVVLIGVPTGLVQFYFKTRKERHDREYGTYNALDEKYVEFQLLCLDHPRLDVFDVPDAKPVELTFEEKKQELIAFTLLFSVFERSFLMYKDQSKKVREKQWTGWQTYLESYCVRENFRSAWQVSGHTFDQRFQDHMVKTLHDLFSDSSRGSHDLRSGNIETPAEAAPNTGPKADG
jgi:hypothetical protein